MAMNDVSVIVVATIDVLAGMEERAEQVLRSAIPAVHAEPGCQRYALHRASNSSTTFVMVEKWQSAAALDRHVEAAAFTELTAALADCLAKPIDISVVTPIPEGDDHLGRI